MAVLRKSFFRFPSTKLGKWAVGLAAFFVAMYVTHFRLMDAVYQLPVVRDPPYDHEPFSIFTVWQIYYWWIWICGLLAIIVGLLALIIQHERSWLVWLTVLFGAAMICGYLLMVILFFASNS